MSASDAVWQSLAAKAKKEKVGTLHTPTDLTLTSVVPFGLPTGIPQLDLALSRPGYPIGRILEFYGFEASGKSTLALHAAAAMQRSGGGVLWMDTEQCFDPTRASQLGVDVKGNFRVVSPDTIDDVFNWFNMLMETLEAAKNTKPFLVVVDSITGVSTEENLGKDPGDAERVGSDAKMIRSGLRKLNPRLAKAKVTTIFVNHLITNVGTRPGSKPSMSAGGRAIKFFATVRVQLGSGKDLWFGEDDEQEKKDKEHRERIGQEIFFKVEKLKGAPLRFPSFKVDLLNDCGFDAHGSLLNAMQAVGQVTRPKSGKVYTMTESGETFMRASWDDYIEANGGFLKMYSSFLEYAKSKEYLFPYLITKGVGEILDDDNGGESDDDDHGGNDGQSA